MPVRLSSDDRRYLEKLVGRKMRPTSRQKAQALLRLDSGDPPENVSMRVGITKEELAFLAGRFANGGLEAVGLLRSQRKSIVPAVGTLSGDTQRSRRPLEFAAARRGSQVREFLSGSSSRLARRVPPRDNS